MNLIWSGPELFEDEPETGSPDELESDDCPNGQQMIEETDHAA